MDYIGESVAIGVVTVDKDGYDQIMVMHGTIEKDGESLMFLTEGELPFEMSENWLKRLKPVVEEMGEHFQGSNYCLLVGRITSDKKWVMEE